MIAGRIEIIALMVLASTLASPKRVQAADTATVQKQLESTLLGHKVKGAKLSAHVVDVATGKTIYDHQSDQPRIPASNAKLMVMAAAIDQLGADFQFETLFALRGDDLLIIGGGDPAFGDPRLSEARNESTTAAFHRVADALLAAGIREIKGSILYDDSIFDAEFIHPNWPSDQRQAWYEAPIGGLNLTDNCVEVFVEPGTKGAAAKVRLSPGNTALKVKNQTQTSKSHKPLVGRYAGSSELRVSGPVSKAAALGEITVHDPGEFFAASLKTVLAARDIAVRGGYDRKRLRNADFSIPTDLKVIHRERTPLTDVLQRAGKNSLGMMAEGLFKMIGVRQARLGSFANGRAAMARFMERCGVSQGQFRFDDGSGLSRSNKLSASAATAVLRHMANGPHAEMLRNALSISGTDGTLVKRMKEIRGRVYGKTGYINGVRSLSGYVRTDNGRWLAFAFFYDGAGSTGPLTKAQDDACRILARWSGS